MHHSGDKQEKLKVYGLFFFLKMDTALEAFGEIPHTEC